MDVVRAGAAQQGPALGAPSAAGVELEAQPCWGHDQPFVPGVVRAPGCCGAPGCAVCGAQQGLFQHKQQGGMGLVPGA